MRAPVVLTFALALTLGFGGAACSSKRELRNDAGADASLGRPAPGTVLADGGVAPGDAGAVGVDAGPSDDALPTANAPELGLRGKHLLEAIVQDNPELANDLIFPRDAFVSAKDVPDPPKVWDKKLSPSFQRDVHTFHKRLKGKEAQFVALEIGQAITRVIPKKRDFKKPLWRVKHSKLLFTIEGKPQRVEIGEMVSWRGAWYITKLR